MIMGTFFYPCEVLATNRILRSSVVAQKQAGFVTIFQQLSKIYQSGSLWRGYIPYVSSMLVKILPLKIAYGASKYDDIVGSIIVTGFGTFFANPLEILTTRYQNVDFKRDSFTEDLKRTFRNEKTSLFRTGFYHALARNLTFMFFMTQRMESPDSILTAITLGTVLSHPFEVLKSRQMWASTGGQYEKLAVGEKVGAGLKQVWKEEGVQGLFRGLVPRWIFYFFIGMSMFKREEQIRRGNR